MSKNKTAEQKNMGKRKKTVPQKSVEKQKKSVLQKSEEKQKKSVLQKSEEKQKKSVPQKSVEKQKKTGKQSGKDCCPVAKRCGGCSFQGVAYKEQLERKQKQVAELLKGICPVQEIIGMEQPLHYRNKVHAVFDYVKGGKIVSGIYEEGTHHVIPVDSCMIENQTADVIIRDIRDLLPSFKIKTYDEDTGYGLFRHVLIRVGAHSGEVMVVLVLSSPVLPSKNNFVKALRVLHPEITTIVLNVNDQRTSMVLGQRNITLYGRGYIEDKLCGYTFRISPSSFYQVNPIQTEILYQKAIELAALSGKERVIDAYCGTGTIGIIASKAAGEVLGIELNPDAIKDAEANAKRNQIRNIHFCRADAGKYMVQMAEQGQKADVVIMDPPRTGSSEAFINSVAKLNPDRVVYVSCNPETLVRDLRLFQKKGYRAMEAWPVDMFPWTMHVETCVLLSHQDVDRYVKMDYVPENADYMQNVKQKCTYGDITDWVQKNYGLRVTNLNIAQVKAKCGLEMRQNYNLGKEGHKVPNTPKEKEDAIIAALKYYKMI